MRCVRSFAWNDEGAVSDDAAPVPGVVMPLRTAVHVTPSKPLRVLLGWQTVRCIAFDAEIAAFDGDWFQMLVTRVYPHDDDADDVDGRGVEYDGFVVCRANEVTAVAATKEAE